MFTGSLAVTGLIALAAIAITTLRALRRARALRAQLHAADAALDQARYEARHDKLTGLPNRRAALEHLTTSPVAMIGLLDLDGFKSVNDRYGHDVGDHLLSVLASRLTLALTEQGMVARLAGDEFLLVWSHRPSIPLAAAGHVLGQVLRPVNIQGHELAPSASLGLALSGPDLTGHDLLVAADHAMYEAKSQHAAHPSAISSGGSGPDDNGSDDIADEGATREQVHLYTGATPPGPVDRSGPGRRSLRHHVDEDAG